MDIDGLKRPFRPNGDKNIYIAINGKRSWSGYNLYLVPSRIARYESNGIEYDSDEVFSTTIHETAHTSHILIMNSGLIQYIQVSTLIRESWPIAVEWWLTKLEYKNTRGIINYGDYNFSTPVQYPNRYAYQYWNKSISSVDYTTMFINLFDNHNELNQWYGGIQGTINDLVQDYTFSGIESNILVHSYGNTSLTNNLKNFKPNGVTNEQIDILMQYY